MGLAVSCRCGGSGAPEFGSWSRSANAGAVGTPRITAATASQLRMRAGLLPLNLRGCAHLTDSRPQCTSVAPRRRNLRARCDLPACWNAIAGAAKVRVYRVQARGLARAGAPSALHRLEEVPVRLGVLHLVEQEFDRGELVHGVQELAQDPHLGELALVGDELLLARAGAVDVDRREYPLLGDAPVEVDFAVAGALELLVDDVVHLRAGIDERRGEDRQAAALLAIARRAEDALRTLQRVGPHAAPGSEALLGPGAKYRGGRQPDDPRHGAHRYRLEDGR